MKIKRVSEMGDGRSEMGRLFVYGYDYVYETNFDRLTGKSGEIK
jgi:hypothetical protein